MVLFSALPNIPQRQPLQWPEAICQPSEDSSLPGFSEVDQCQKYDRRLMLSVTTQIYGKLARRQTLVKPLHSAPETAIGLPKYHTLPDTKPLHKKP